MSNRERLYLLAALPGALVAVAIPEILGWKDSGLAIGAIAISFMLLAMWIIDPFEIGRHRRDRQHPAS